MVFEGDRDQQKLKRDNVSEKNYSVKYHATEQNYTHSHKSLGSDVAVKNQRSLRKDSQHENIGKLDVNSVSGVMGTQQHSPNPNIRPTISEDDEELGVQRFNQRGRAQTMRQGDMMYTQPVTEELEHVVPKKHGF